MTPPLESLKSKFFKAYSEDASKMLLVTGTLSWATSAAGQIFGIATNKKTSKKEKKFLVPQEMLDAAINITSFYIVTHQIQGLTKKLVSKGKVITPEIKRFCLDNGIKFTKEKGETVNIGKSILNKVKAYQSTIEINDSNKIGMDKKKIDGLKAEIGKLNKFYDEKYSPFEGGFAVAGSITGAILSSNIITPILRNPMAAAKQKNAIAHEKLEHDAALYNSKPSVHGKKRMGPDDFKSKLNSPLSVMPSGSMRI